MSSRHAKQLKWELKAGETFFDIISYKYYMIAFLMGTHSHVIAGSGKVFHFYKLDTTIIIMSVERFHFRWTRHLFLEYRLDESFV